LEERRPIWCKKKMSQKYPLSLRPKKRGVPREPITLGATLKGESATVRTKVVGPVRTQALFAFIAGEHTRRKNLVAQTPLTGTGNPNSHPFVKVSGYKLTG